MSGAITSCRASISPCPRARPRCCSAATAPARPRRCAPSWACGRPPRARSSLDGRAHREARDPGYRPARRRLCAGKHGGVLGSVGEGKPGAGGARRSARRCQAGVDFRVFPGAEAVLAVARRRAVRRTEADAFDRARHRRAAQAAADRRADQGAGAGDRGGADRMPRRDQAPRRHHSAGRTEFPCRARARRQGCW